MQIAKAIAPVICEALVLMLKSLLSMFGEGQSKEKSEVCQVNEAMREWLYGPIALSGKLQERHLQGSFD